MRTTSEVFIFVKTDPNTEDSVAHNLKSKGFTVRITSQRFDFNIVIIFDASRKNLSSLQNEIQSISGVKSVTILPSFPA